MDTERGWLKKSLDDATARVRNWPEWKRSLASAMTGNRAVRVGPTPATPAAPPAANHSTASK